MIKDALEFCFNTVRNAVDPVKLSEDHHRIEYAMADGTVYSSPKNPEPRRGIANDLRTIAYLAQTGAEIWISDFDVELVNDPRQVEAETPDGPVLAGGHAHDRYRFPLNDSAAVELLNTTRPHKKFIHKLKTILQNTIPAETIANLANLSQETIDRQESHTGPQGESLGKSMMREVHSGHEIPEYLDLAIPRWAGLDIQIAVTCVLTINERLELTLSPTDETWQAADKAARELLHGLIEDQLAEHSTNGVHIVFGQFDAQD